MMQLADERERLYELWSSRMSTWYNTKNYSFESLDHYLAFCVSKDWLQDITDVMITHRRAGFSEDPAQAYTEFWGILQAAVTQQEALKEMHYSLTGEKQLPKRITNDGAWSRVRRLRVLAVGHPNRQGNFERRSTTSRCRKTYERIDLIVFQNSKRTIERIELGKLLDDFDQEASKVLRQHRLALQTQLDAC